ncbi:unnamed protein product, partial [Symbiodinium pilosum]
MAQQWDDWAMLNWIHIASNNHDQTAMVTFQVTETLLGGITEEPSMELGPQAVAANASPQLADFDPEYLPGLSGATVAFMKTQEARHWVYRFMEGLATDAMIQNRFGAEVAEIFHMWVAVRDNVDMEVRNCLAAGGDLAPVASAVGEEAAAESDKSTVMVDGDGGVKLGLLVKMMEVKGLLLQAMLRIWKDALARIVLEQMELLPVQKLLAELFETLQAPGIAGERDYRVPEGDLNAENYAGVMSEANDLGNEHAQMEENCIPARWSE